MDQGSLIGSIEKAIEEGDLNTLKTIASSIPEESVTDAFSCCKKIQWTPLTLAIVKKNVSILKFLLEDCHVDPMVQDMFKVYPLFWATSGGEFEITKLLVESGARINEFANCYNSPLNVACQSKDPRIAHYLIEKGGDIDKSKCLMSAIAYSRNSEFIKYLLECGADINVKDGGRTALHACCQKRNLEIFKLLVEKGAINCANDDGVNPLQLAALTGRKRIFSFFSKKRGHTRDEILDCHELQGVYSLLRNNTPASVRLWNNVLKERPRMKKSSFFESFQRNSHQIENYNDLMDDREGAIIHSLIILERIFGINLWVISSYLSLLIKHVSIKNTEFWNEILNYESKCSEESYLHVCIAIYASKFRRYVKRLNFQNIDETILNMTIRFIDISLKVETNLPCSSDLRRTDIRSLSRSFCYLNFESAGLLLVICMCSVKEGATDFRAIIENFLNPRPYLSQTFLHVLIRYHRGWKLPQSIVYDVFDLFCRFDGDSVNNLNERCDTPLHIALETYGNNEFIDILLKYGALTDKRNSNCKSIRELARKNNRQDICIGPSSLQIVVKEKLEQKSEENQNDLPSVLQHYIKFH